MSTETGDEGDSTMITLDQTHPFSGREVVAPVGGATGWRAPSIVMIAYDGRRWQHHLKRSTPYRDPFETWTSFSLWESSSMLRTMESARRE
jgi:hypothetical protein